MQKFQDWVEQNIQENMGAAAPDDKELDVLNSQMKILIGKMKNIISRTSNKNKGYAILHQIAQECQEAMGISDTNLKKAVLGQMPSQQN